MSTFFQLLSSARAAALFAVCSFIVFAGTAFTQDNAAQLGGPAKKELREEYSRADYEEFLRKQRNGEIPLQSSVVPSSGTSDVLVNNNGGATGTSGFTQSETCILAFGNNVVIGFNDAGSYGGTTNHFTGWSYSTDGGVSFTDGGALPNSTGGDAGDPVMARNESTGRIYFSTLGFSTSTIQMFRSDDNGVTWMAPVNATPGGSTEDKQWHVVDNFAGSGNGNVYLISRNFGTGNGIYMYRSTDHGATFGPTNGVLIASGAAGNVQGAFVAVGPDHSVHAFFFDDVNNAIKVRKSTDQGVSFAAAVTIASGLGGGTNGDRGLTGIRQGTVSASGFRSNAFPHAVINPISGNIYVTYSNDGPGADKTDVQFVQSTDGGATWGTPITVNDDATTTDQWQPTIAVTPDGTALGIFYYSRQEDAANNLFKFYGRTALIAGSTVTFSPSFAISDVASLPEFGRDSFINSVYMGDYDHAAATPGFFHVVWADNRDNLAGGGDRKDPNVYYKKIPAGLLAGPNIAVFPSDINFGAIVVGQTGGPTTVTIQNIGDADLTVNSIGSPAADFSTSNLPGLPAVIPSLGTVTLDVSFSPLSSGTQNSSFDIGSDALNTPTETVSLEGRGFVPVGNDLCANAIAINCGESVNGSTADATFDNIGTCGTTNTAPGVWYTVVGTGGVMSVSTCTAASYDTKLSVFSGSCGTLVCVGGNDDFCSTRSQVSWSSVSGTTYHILVHGSGSQTGTFTLSTSTCPALISVNPPSFNITLPPNGTGSGTIDISNIASAGALDLNWSISAFSTGPATAPVFGSIAGSNSIETPGPMFQFTDRSLQTLRSQNVPADVLGKLEDLRNAAPVTKDVFFEQAETLLGTKAEHSIHQLLFDHTMIVETEKKGDAAQTAAAPPGFVTDGFGGPDGFGYSWIDSDESGGPVFNWVDISGTGTSVVLTDDATTGRIPLGMTFPFYGVTQDSIRIAANGFLNFGAVASGITNATIPTVATPNNIICPFWDDLNPALGGTIHYLATDTQFIVQYTGIKRFDSPNPAQTFQVILNADGSILFQYLTVNAPVNSTTVGIENATGTVGLLVAFNAAYLHNNLAVRISAGDPCGWITSVTPASGSVSPGGFDQVTIDVDATGLVAGTYNCEFKIYSNAANGGQLIVPAILTVSDVTDAPVVNSPITAGATSVSGTGPETIIAIGGVKSPVGGTLITVYVNSDSVGAASVTGGGSWTLSGMAALAAGDTVKAKATALNKLPSSFSNEVIVSGLFTVTATAPPQNGVFTLPGPFTYDVTFSAPVNPASVATSDLTLSGIAGAFVSGATVLAGDTIVRFTISGISVEGVLTASINAGQITNTSGDPNSLFSADYQVDFVTASYPTPLLSVNPLGSLVYDPSISGVVSFAGDVDNFTLNLDANQTLSLILTPTSPGLQPRIELFDPANVSLGFASAPAAGQISGIQTRSITSGGVHRFAVSGTGGSVGGYTLEAILNSAFELEGKVVGATNNTAGTAQSISGSFLTLLTSLGSAQRGAVLGTLSDAQDWYSMTLSAGDKVTLGLKALSAGGLGMTLVASDGSTPIATGGAGSTNLDLVVANFAIPTAGTYYVLLAPVVVTNTNPKSVTGGVDIDYNLVVTRNAAFDTEDNDLLATAQPITNGVLGAITAGNADWYQIVLAGGEAGINAETSTPADGPGQFVNTVNPRIELYNSSATLIASGVPLGDGRNEKFNATGLTAGGTYYIKVTGEGGTVGEYFLGVANVAAPPVAVNVITNPGFESGTGPWFYFTNGTGSYVQSVPGANGSGNAAKVTVTTTGSNVQFYQSGITLQSNTLYRLSFKAYSSNGRDLAGTVQRHDAPYTNYGLDNVVFPLTTSWQEFEVQFTTVNFPPPTPSNARLRFRMNGYAINGTVYYIDDVILEEVSVAPPVATKIRVETAADGSGGVVPAQSIETGNSITVYAISRTAADVFVANVAATAWSLEDISGGVLPAHLVPSGDNKSAVFNATVAGTTKIKAVLGGLTPTTSEVITVIDPPPPATNLLVNGGFESGTGNWTFSTNGVGSMSLTPGIVGANAAQVSITTQGTTTQLYQKDITLTAGNSYRLSIKASCNTGHDISLSIFKHTTPFTSYGLTSFVCDLTSGWQSYTVDFVASGFAGTVSDARLRVWMGIYDANGDVYRFDDVKLEELTVPPVVGGAISAGTEATEIPTAFALQQNYPNPFNPTTAIRFALPVDANVTLAVYNVLGQQVAELMNGQVTAGYHEIPFDASSLASGIYVYRLTATSGTETHFTEVRKLVLMK